MVQGTVRIPGALFGVLALLLVVGCTEPHPDLADLKGTPGSSAEYPGALVYQRGENKASYRIDGQVPASITIYACTGDPGTTVEDWFDTTLTRNGWHRDSPGHQDRLGAFQGGASWRRGNARFDLNLMTSATTAELAKKANQPSGCPTGYETLAQIG